MSESETHSERQTSIKDSIAELCRDQWGQSGGVRLFEV